jgi:3',5'-cyclic AMP phosphodiesterase CpdA
VPALLDAASEDSLAEPPDSIALISDTHIAADPAAINLGQNMAENLRWMVADLLSLPSLPAAAFLNGDLALKDGQAGDYRILLELLEPLHRAGVPLHMGLGNHDDRSQFRAVLQEATNARPSDAAKHYSNVTISLGSPETPTRLRVFVLDSLNKVDDVPGLLGPEQLLWLQDRLDDPADAALPSLVLVHHHPSELPNALIDTEALLRVLGPRRQVKALVFGHTHVWSTRQRDDGLWLVNLPAVAFPFDPGQPLGWVRLTPARLGARLELRAVGGDLTKDREVIELAWR